MSASCERGRAGRGEVVREGARDGVKDTNKDKIDQYSSLSQMCEKYNAVNAK